MFKKSSPSIHFKFYDKLLYDLIVIFFIIIIDLYTVLQLGFCEVSDPSIVSAIRMLVKLPEHTWGLPSVQDNVNWSNPQFSVARTGTLFCL